jgi:hypothetical protein
VGGITLENGAGALIAFLLAALLAASDAQPELLAAASTRSAEEPSPRRLFNAGLRAEERGDLGEACRLFMAARLVPRLSFADELYARGAALRQVRLLAGRDEDAATAAALLLGATGAESGDLGPLIGRLLRRFEPGAKRPLEQHTGTIVSLRFHRPSGHVLVEVEIDGGERRIIEAEGVVAPFSAGDRVAIVIRRIKGHAAAGWRLVAMGQERSDGWQILRVESL